MNAEMAFELRPLLDAYWTAQTREDEREAYQHLRSIGFPPCYGEDKPRIRVKAVTVK